MNTLLYLYLIYLSWGTEGQGRVSILEMSRYLRLSKTETRSRMFEMAKQDYVEIIETFSEKNSKKLYVQLATIGEEFLMQNYDAAIDAYHLHVAETIAAIKERNAEQPFTPKKLTKKQLAAIEAGQKELF